MANNKKSFLFYADWIETFDDLTNEESGQLIKHILKYVNDENPRTTNRIIRTAFIQIRLQLKRDLNKWKKIIEGRSKAGLASAEVRKQKSTNPTSVKSVKSISTNPTVNVNDNVNVNVSVNVNDINKRKEGFKKSLYSHKEIYNSLLLQEFYEYWSEHNEKGKKMRFEYAKNQPFDIKRRLTTWFYKQREFNKEKSSDKKEKTAYEVIQDIKHGR